VDGSRNQQSGERTFRRTAVILRLSDFSVRTAASPSVVRRGTSTLPKIMSSVHHVCWRMAVAIFSLNWATRAASNRSSSAWARASSGRSAPDPASPRSTLVPVHVSPVR
jgi:hypothetical protein